MGSLANPAGAGIQRFARPPCDGVASFHRSLPRRNVRFAAVAVKSNTAPFARPLYSARLFHLAVSPQDNTLAISTGCSARFS